MSASRTSVLAGGAALGLVLGRLATSPSGRLARLGGWSIAGPTAAGWATDFLNAAYFRRPPAWREVSDLRCAYSVLTTRWYQLGGRRLHGGDVAAFHRAFGVDRIVHRERSPRGTLDRDQLLEGGSRLLGDWFPAAYADPSRRGWGIAFETPQERRRYRPELRLVHARLGPLTPPSAPGVQQAWHSYAPVEIPSADAAVAMLLDPARWPDAASELGRFTPLRSGDLEGNTMEIEVVGHPTGRTPVYLRAYVTATRVLADGDALGAWAAEVNDGLARFGRDQAPLVPDGARPRLALELTTHEGHFLGNARSRIVCYELDGRAFLRASGTWDPLRWDLARLYERAGYTAQHAMWGEGAPAQSLLHQVGAVSDQDRRGRA